MTLPAEQFERELEIFRQESNSAVQFLYAYLTIHSVAGTRQNVRRLLNRNALFWNTNLAALQTAAFIATGRIFDQDSAHNVDRLLGVAQRNPHLFSKAAFAARRQGTNPKPPGYLEEYLKDLYVPKARDFRVLRMQVRDWRRIYERNYRDIRHKIFAHKEIDDPQVIADLMSRTNIRELQRMLVFLQRLHSALQSLFLNGSKPVLPRRRYSIANIRRSPTPAARVSGVQDRITEDVDEFLRAAAKKLIEPSARAPPRRRAARIMTVTAE